MSEAGVSFNVTETAKIMASDAAMDAALIECFAGIASYGPSHPSYPWWYYMIKAIMAKKIGLGVQGMRFVHVLVAKNKDEKSAMAYQVGVVFHYAILAAKLKEEWDWYPVKHDADEAHYTFVNRNTGERVDYSFTYKDALDAGIVNTHPASPWVKHRRIMLFANLIRQFSSMFSPTVSLSIPMDYVSVGVGAVESGLDIGAIADAQPEDVVAIDGVILDNEAARPRTIQLPGAYVKRLKELGIYEAFEMQTGCKITVGERAKPDENIIGLIRELKATKESGGDTENPDIGKRFGFSPAIINVENPGDMAAFAPQAGTIDPFASVPEVEL